MSTTTRAGAVGREPAVPLPVSVTLASGRAAHTPPAWRAAALGVLGVGVASGWVAARSRHGWVLVIATGAGLVGAAIPVVGGGRLGRRQRSRTGSATLGSAASSGSASPGSTTSGAPAPAGADPPPRATVLVPARDEAEVIAGLCADLGAQDHRDPDGRPRFEVVFIDDRSSDGTGDVIAAAVAAAGIADVTRIVRRAGAHLPDGKGAALAEVPPDDCRGRAIVVLDADARIGPSFVRHAATHVAAGTPAMTARRLVLRSATTRLATTEADEQAVDRSIQLARWSIGGCSEFRGNGLVVDRDALIAAGGWGPPTLTEDLDLSTRLAARLGVRVAFAGDLDVWETPVEDLGDLWAQRLRWAEGSIRRFLEHGGGVVRSRALTPAARLEFALYGLGHALAPFALGLAGGGIVGRRIARPGAFLATYSATGMTLAWTALGAERLADDPPPRPVARLARAVRVTAFGAGWAVVVPAALWRVGTRRGPLRFAKTPHHVPRGPVA